MTENNILNIKISNSQLNKLKLGIENGTQVALKFNQILLVILMMKIIFLILLLTNTQVSRLCKAFAKNSQLI